MAFPGGKGKRPGTSGWIVLGGLGTALSVGILAQAHGAPPPASVRAVGEKAAPHAQRLSRDTRTHDFIVQLREPVAPADYQAIAATGARITRRFRTMPMVGISAPGTTLGRLALLPAVTRISPDLVVHKTMEFAAPAVGAAAARQNLGATGKGVGIAVIDSGISAHDDLKPNAAQAGRASQRIVGGYDWVIARKDTLANDKCGHGTHIAGIIAGNGNGSANGSRHFVGIAPEANLIDLRILDGNGIGRVVDAIDALDWCIQNKTALNVRVANLSLGHPPGESWKTDPLCQAAERAWKAGIVVVCAAGNRGRKVASDPKSGVQWGTINSPGNDPYVLTVGSVNDYGTAGVADDWISTYSSRGPTLGDRVLKPDVVAPGNQIVSLCELGARLERELGPQNKVPAAYYDSTAGANNSAVYYRLSGTSMAAGVVSGAAALLIQKDPSLTPSDVKARLMRTARKTWHGTGRTPSIFSRGAGYLNIPAALTSNYRVAGYALSPYCTLQNGQVQIHFLAQPTATTVGPGQALWGDEGAAAPQPNSDGFDNSSNRAGPVWGDQALWGDEGFDQQSGAALCADQALWGDEGFAGPANVSYDQALWGDEGYASPASVSYDQALWGDEGCYSNVGADISRVAVYGDVK